MAQATQEEDGYATQSIGGEVAALWGASVWTCLEADEPQGPSKQQLPLPGVGKEDFNQGASI